MKHLFTLLLAILTIFAASALTCPGYYSYLRNDTLIIGNNRIERKFLWNGGNVITVTLSDKQNNHTWNNTATEPDFFIMKEPVNSGNATWEAREIPENEIHPAYLESEITYTLNALQIKRIYRIYADCPAIVTETHLKGYTNALFTGENENNADLKNIESTKDMQNRQLTPVLDRLSLPGKHWKIKAVEFFDVTDRNNTLVFEYDALSYRKNFHKGNILFVRNEENEKGFFFLKEAPCSSVQLSSPGYDFTSEFGTFTVNGLGIDGNDIIQNDWVKTHSSVLGIYEGNELNRLTALRNYQKNIRKLMPERDEMVMMNTWGDRGQDTKVNEAFCLKEVERAAKMGITHFQIDDGWQVGKSPNSALANGSFKNIWSNPDYWKPDKKKYPRGLHPVVEKGEKLGVEICLWFNPSIQDNFADWEKDAQAILDLYNEYGIRTFKIDGLSLPTKQAEINLRKLFDTVLEKTDNAVVFNLDATAGRRAGYHSFNEYGNIFLENRYTDWQNYYPYWTLRNLWQLSKYIPAEKLQIEFLNKWRNNDKYGNDPFAPQNYAFSYLFAITMAAQPLAWFEGSNLPEEALDIKNSIVPYKKIQHEFHSGTILPIGEEPSGKAWTGFQSIDGDKGYFIFYRENNPEEHAYVNTWLPEGIRISCTPILGSGTPFTATTGKQGSIKVKLKDKNTFALYRYTIID
ncbi:MAG: alpha-galactosidase [Bacteroidales bacterium]|nr:alpha-galactosidase [Bacteroidales bacterium]